MKRRLALLLALSLTFAAFPVTGAAATEADQTVVEQTVEETTENNEVETEAAAENEEADTAKSGEEATEAASAVETAEENADEAEAAEPAQEAAEAASTDTEAAPVEEESAAAATTGAEVAAVVEPEAVPATVDPKKVAEEQKLEKVADGWYSNNTVYYKNGAKVTGLQVLKLDGVSRTFFFDANGVKKTGWVTIDNKGTVCYFADGRWLIFSLQCVTGIARYFNRFADDRHEIGIPAPARNNVHMQVIRNARTGNRP